MHDELYITMNFNFKIQQYQTEAVAAVTDVFTGQGFHDAVTYIHDRGKTPFLPNVQTADCEDVGDDTKWKPVQVKLMCISKPFLN